VNTLNYVLSDTEQEGSLDGNDLIVHKLSFIISYILMVNFEINSTFIDLIYFVIMFIRNTRNIKWR